MPVQLKTLKIKVTYNAELDAYNVFIRDQQLDIDINLWCREKPIIEDLTSKRNSE